MSYRVLLALSILRLCSWADFRPLCPPVSSEELCRAQRLLLDYSQAGCRRHGINSSEFLSLVSSAIPGRVVVGFEEGAEPLVRSWLEGWGAKVVKLSRTGGSFAVAELTAMPASDSVVALLTDQLLKACFSMSFIRYAEPVFRARTCWTPNDPLFSNQQWDKWVLYSDRAWDYTTGSRSIRVAVIDEGIDYRHPDLSGQFDANRRGYDFVDNDNDPYPVNAEESHGTHVAGIIAATLNNSVGIAGWANVTLYSVRCLDSSGSGTHEDIADGIRWAVDNGAQIINLSLGSTDASTVLQQAVDYAWNRGALVIAASGNNGTSGVFYPAAYPNALAVGALAPDGKRASFSNWGTELDLIAPGQNIVSAIPFGGYAIFSGTSMAAPQVAGIAALILSYNPNLSNASVRAILEASAIDIAPVGQDVYSGWGLVNPLRAIQLTDLLEREAGARLNGSPCPSELVRVGQILTLPGTSSWDIVDVQGRRVAVSAATDRGGRTLVVNLKPGIYLVRCPVVGDSAAPATKPQAFKLTVLP